MSRKRSSSTVLVTLPSGCAMLNDTPDTTSVSPCWPSDPTVTVCPVLVAMSFHDCHTSAGVSACAAVVDNNPARTHDPRNSRFMIILPIGKFLHQASGAAAVGSRLVIGTQQGTMRFGWNGGDDDSGIGRKVVAITGASRGIGAAAAESFAAAGARLGLIARDAAAVAALAAKTGGMAVAADVADWAAMSGAVQRVCDSFGRLDVLVLNAGVIEPIGPWPRPTGRVGPVDQREPDRCFPRNARRHPGDAGAGRGGRSSWCPRRPRTRPTMDGRPTAQARLARRCWCGKRILKRRRMGAGDGPVARHCGNGHAEGHLGFRVGPVSKLDWSAHIPPEWPARALVWMCGTQADDLVGQELRLRDEALRRRIGLIA